MISKTFAKIVKEAIREEIGLIKEGKKTYYIWSKDGGGTYGIYPKSYGNPKPILKGKEKDLMKVLLKISKHNKSYLEDAFSETADPEMMDELELDLDKMKKLGIKEASEDVVIAKDDDDDYDCDCEDDDDDDDDDEINEISTKAGLNDVIKGRTTSIEGIKFSKELAEKLLYWIQVSPYGRKYGKHILKGRIASSIGPANAMGFGDRLSGKLKGEWKAIVAKHGPKKEGINETRRRTLKRLSEAKTYKSYGLSAKMDFALADLPDKLFNKKGITALAKKLKQDPKKAIAYAKDAFDWLYKEQINLGEKYKPGNKWSDDFDYKGMLAFGSKLKPTGNIKKDLVLFHKVFDSYEDVNYHTEASPLWDAMKKYAQVHALNKKNPAMAGKVAGEADALLSKFNKLSLKTLKSLK